MLLDRLLHRPFPLRLVVFLLVLAVLWLPVAIPVYLLIPDTNTVSILTMTVLVVEFLVLLVIWGRWVYHQPLLRRYGLVADRQNGKELLQGVAIAFLSLFALYALQGMVGWLEWRSPTLSPLRLIGEGVLVGIGVGLGEELLFRGWLLDELERDYSPVISLWANSLAFACLHFIKPLPEILQTSPQFFGLLLLGFTLVWAKRSSQGHLGLAIGLHTGLVWSYYTVDVGDLILYTRTVPEWVTGIHQNPLAGVMGLLFLSGLAYYTKRRTKQRGEQRGDTIQRGDTNL